MIADVCCSENCPVERAEEERRWCKDIDMLLRRGNRHEIPTTSVDVVLIASFLEYFRYVYLGATNGWIQLHALGDYARQIAILWAECLRSVSP
jgi:hypothetical protein